MVNIIAISDIHIGSQDSKSLYEQLKNYFFNYIDKNIDGIDMIIICGDFYDHKISLNEEASKYSIMIEQKLLSYARKGILVRILKGTRSHDLDQLNNFLIDEKRSKGKFRIINHVESETLTGLDDNLSILYLPEEYMENYQEYYKEELKNEYDLCFFHGTFEHQAFQNQITQSERYMKNAPVFRYNDFNEIIKGPIVGGHIHNRSIYKKKIYYTGSFSRWVFGEEKPKGFFHIKYNKENGGYKVKFIENKLAPVFKTLDLNDIWKDIKNLSIEDKIKYIEEQKNLLSEEANLDDNHLRVNVDKTKLPENEAEIIKQYFSDKSDFKLNIQRDNQIAEDEQEENELEEKYSYIIKGQLSLEDTVKKYIKDNYDVDIPIDTVKTILYESEEDNNE